MKRINVCLARTGPTSLKTTLEILGFSPICHTFDISECRKAVGIKSRSNSGIHAGFPGTASQGRCAVQLAVFLTTNHKTLNIYPKITPLVERCTELVKG